MRPVSAARRQPCFPLQGPPGTGKTRTIMGLLSIILHASPANTAGLVQRAAAQPMSEPAREDLPRLWRLAAPWISGTASLRSGHNPQQQRRTCQNCRKCRMAYN
jgi:senataxin